MAITIGVFGLQYVKTLNVPGREWRIVFMPTPEFIAARKTWLPHGILSIGSLLTGLLVSYLWSNIKRSEELSKTTH